MFTIDKNVPMPPEAKPLRNSKYPIQLLEIGESFFVPSEDMKKSRYVRNALAARAKKLDVKVAFVVDDSGVRCWRIS